MSIWFTVSPKMNGTGNKVTANSDERNYLMIACLSVKTETQFNAVAKDIDLLQTEI